MKIKAVLLVLVTITIGMYITPTQPSTQIITSVGEEISPITENSISIPSIDEYIIYAQNSDEFEFLKTLNVNKVYQGLQAVTVDATLTQLQTWDVNLEHTFRTSAYAQFSYDDMTGGITLDNGPDAGIMDVDRLWTEGYNGTGVNVGVFDNGIFAAHPGLTGKVVLTGNFNYFDGETAPICRSHGTPVAGTIAATGKKADGTTDLSLRGNAFGAKLVEIAIGCGDGNALLGNFIDAMDWIIAQNASIDVLNNSWGGSPNSLIFEDFTKILNELGVVVVASAGNEGPRPFTAGGNPGNNQYGIGVGAIDYNENIVGFSSHGPIQGGLVKPDLLAPGSNVITSQVDGTYGPISGTSFSSPLTAGAFATLISALKANSINYNVGVLKAAMMNNASRIGLDEMTQGAGIPQTYDSFLNIMNAPLGTDSVPQVIHMTPNQGIQPHPYFQRIFSDSKLNIPVTVVSSHPLDTTITVSGNLAGIASFSTILDAYSQRIEMKLDTTGKNAGTYSGDVTLQLGNIKQVVSYSIEVLGDASSRILLDTRHSVREAEGMYTYSGGTTAEFINKAIDNGVWVEINNQELTEQYLSNFDIYWFADGLELQDLAEPSPVLSQPYLTTELDALDTFVDNGNNIFINFNGYMLNTQYNYIYGTNTSRINPLLERFGVSVQNTPFDDAELSKFTNLSNSTSLSGGVKLIDHQSSTFDVTGDAIKIGDAVGTSIALHERVNGGRVVVSSSDAWFNNEAVLGNGPATTSNTKFVDQLFSFLSSENEVKLLEYTISGSTITGKYQIVNNGIVQSSSPTLIREGNELLTEIEITTSKDANNIFSFTYEATTDGLHEIVMKNGDEYAKWSLTVDNTGPLILPLEDNPQNNNFAETSSLFMKFSAKDSISDIKKSNFAIYLEGVDLTDSLTTGYNTQTYQLNILLPANQLNESSSYIYNLTITAPDENNNLGILNYFFSMDPNKPIGTPETTTTTTTTTSSIMTTTTETTPTSSDTSTTQPLSTTDEGPIAFVLSILSLIVFTLYRRRK